jgi:hypothetical protein
VACELVTPEEIGKLLGRTITSTFPTDDPLYCMWNTRSTPGIVGDVRISVDMNPVDPRGAIERMTQRGGKRIDGLGQDAAIALRNRPDFYKVMAHSDGMLIEVTVVGDPAQLKADQVIELTRLVLSRL